MNRKRLDKLKREIALARRSPQKAADLERFARRLGRRSVKKRGKEPMWESAEFDDLFVLSIPHHGGRDLAPGTQRSILDQLEDDILAWEEKLNDEDDDEQEDESDSGAGNGTG
jgi:hypothetical protein